MVNFDGMGEVVQRVKQADSYILLIIMCFLSNSAFAGAADYVLSPIVNQGERELDIKLGAASPVAGASAQASSIGLGYGVTERWFSEGYLKKERLGAQEATLAEWENRFQLTETGKYPLDMGLLSELEAPLSGRAPWSIRLGALFQRESGKLQLNGNLLFEKAFGMADENGVPFATNFGYQWQMKYRWRPALEFGLQGMGELGKWDNWANQAGQNHRAGPALFGKLPLGQHRALKYNVACLFGVSAAAPSQTLRTQIEYEF